MPSRKIEVLKSPTLREEVYQTTLPSGLRVYACPKPGYRKKYACYSTFYGSVDNNFSIRSDSDAKSDAEAVSGRVQVPDGIAHFLEHTLFETERGNASDLFARNGAYNNAATSFTTTTYLFASSDRFYDNLELLMSFVENPAFDPERVEKERGIIEEEIKGYQDSADWVSYMGLLENLFHDHPVRIDIAGTAETIRQIDVPTLECCYRSFYHPSNMSLFVTGDLDVDELFDFVAAQSRQEGPPGGVAERFFPAEPASVAKKETRRTMEVALPKLLLGFKEVNVPTTGKEYVLRELLSDMALEILFGRSSDIFRELYEKGLALDDFSASYSAGSGIGYALIGGDTPSPDDLRDALLDRAAHWRSKGLEEDDFQREKRKFIGGFIRGFNSLEYIANYYTYFRFHDFDLFGTIDLLHEVSREMLEERVRQLLEPELSASFVVLPES